MNKKRILQIILVICVIMAVIMGSKKWIFAKEKTLILPGSKKEIIVPTKRNKLFLYKIGNTATEILDSSDVEDAEFIIKYIVGSGKLNKGQIQTLNEVRDMLFEEIKPLNQRLNTLRARIPESLNRLALIGRYHVCDYDNMSSNPFDIAWWPMDHTSTRALRETKDLEQIGYVDLTYSIDKVKYNCFPEGPGPHRSNFNTNILFLKDKGDLHYQECSGKEQEEWRQFINENPDFFEVQEKLLELYTIVNEGIDEVFPNGIASVYAQEFLYNNRYNSLKDFN